MNTPLNGPPIINLQWRHNHSIPSWKHCGDRISPEWRTPTFPSPGAPSPRQAAGRAPGVPDGSLHGDERIYRRLHSAAGGKALGRASFWTLFLKRARHSIYDSGPPRTLALQRMILPDRHNQLDNAGLSLARHHSTVMVPASRLSLCHHFTDIPLP